MALFEKGNEWWRQRSKHGRDKLFNTPELLLEAAYEYFKNCDDNPWVKTKKSQFDKGEFSGDSTEETPIQKPYTRSGLFLYLECSESWLREFKKTATPDFLRVIEHIENIIDTQQLEGATVGVFNANIIARVLGLKERVDQTTNGHDITLPLTPEQAKKIADELDNEY